MKTFSILSFAIIISLTIGWIYFDRVEKVYAHLLMFEDTDLQNELIDQVKALNIKHALGENRELFVSEEEVEKVRRLMQNISPMIPVDEVHLYYTDSKIMELIEERLKTEAVSYKIVKYDDKTGIAVYKKDRNIWGKILENIENNYIWQTKN